MKKTIINIILVVIALFIYFLQSNFFNWFNIAGIMPNMFVIYILFIGLFAGTKLGSIYGLALGFILDCAIGTKIGIYTLCLGIIGFLSGIFDKNFSKDSRMTVMLMVLGSTIVFEIIKYILSYFFISTNAEIFSFVKILIIETIYNIILTIILYPIFRKFGYYIENEYKGNTVLTRYF